MDAEKAIRDAQVLQEHCQALYKASLKAEAGREVLRGRFDAILHAGAQMARARKQRADVEYALFEALQLWDV
jgi:hypothetical protein